VQHVALCSRRHCSIQNTEGFFSKYILMSLKVFYFMATIFVSMLTVCTLSSVI